MTNTYKMIFTWEGKEEPLDYYLNYPEDGVYEGEAEFATLSEFNEIIKEWEGHLYQMFKNGSSDVIGLGILDPAAPIEEIAVAGVDCCGDCADCFWNAAYRQRYGGGSFWNEYKPSGCKVKGADNNDDQKQR